MRSLLLGLAALLLPAVADAEPSLWSFEARLGGGLAMGGGGGAAAFRLAPFTLGARGEYTFHEHPTAGLWIGALVEGVDRIGVGAEAGVAVRPSNGGTRLSAGVITFLFPYTLVGGSASGGYCYGVGAHNHTYLCMDAVLNFFFLGSDLPTDRVAAQLLLVGALRFDAL